MIYLGLIMKLTVAITLLFSGIAKTLDIKTSARISAAVDILPRKLGYIFGLLLPIIEILLGIALLIEFKVPLVLSLVFITFVVFFIVNLKIMINGTDLGCNCYGKVLSGKMGKGGLFNSIVLIFYCFLIIMLPNMSMSDFLSVATSFESFSIVLPVVGLFVTSLLTRAID
ncbi:MauE/DoxX family redox-associated membrane protein [Paenibacillus sp. MBLB4367]|uniref:MauE/DoxX family redox-associated membrane protein n=1 Tax=Paenibacillus sp. MBLB4367 TaxID=3384767 RepID=UPI003907F860